MDLVVRYVNDTVVTGSDIRVRAAERFEDYTRKGKPTPSNRPESIAFFKEALEDLTDEELLIQYGKQFATEHKIQLVDHDAIAQQVIEQARSTGRRMTLREQAEQRKRLERFRTIQAVLGYFESRNARITPNELYEEYLARAHKYHRPAQAKVLQILLRPSDKAERKEVRGQKLALFKNLQNAVDAGLRAIVESRLDRYLAGSTEEQDRLLDETTSAVAAMATRTDLVPADLPLVVTARKIVDRQAAFRDQDATLKQLADIRAKLAGRDATAFMDQAKASSQGPKASDGGDLGWIEPGTYSPGFDAVAFTLAPGTLSEVFWSEDTANLLFVTERKEARTLPFAEVSAEIETELFEVQRDETKKRMVAMLRSKASIVNAIPIDQVVE